MPKLYLEIFNAKGMGYPGVPHSGIFKEHKELLKFINDIAINVPGVRGTPALPSKQLNDLRPLSFKE